MKKKEINYQIVAFDQSINAIVSTTSSLLQFCGDLFNEDRYDILDTILVECDLLGIGIGGLKKATGINYKLIPKLARIVRKSMRRYERERERYKSSLRSNVQINEPRKPTEVIFCLREIRRLTWTLAKDASVKGRGDGESSEEEFFKWLSDYERREKEKKKVELYLY